MTNETIDGIYNKVLVRTYTTEGMKGKVAGMSIDGTSMKRSGSAFATADAVNYTYNSRSEVVDALSNAIPAHKFNFAYDPIGNRLASAQEVENLTYTSTPLTRDGWTQVLNGENRLYDSITDAYEDIKSVIDAI